MRISPAVSSISPATRLSVVVLPQPGRPDERHELAVRDGQRNAIDGQVPAVGLAPRRVSLTWPSRAPPDPSRPVHDLTAPSVSALTNHFCEHEEQHDHRDAHDERRRHQPRPVARELGEEALEADRQGEPALRR